MEKKKIIITGANGYLGSNLIKYLSNLNYDLTCIYKNKLKKKIIKKNVNYIKHNLLRKIPLKKINGDFYAILHFAGPKNDRKSISKGKKKLLQAITLDKNVIKFCIQKKINYMIYASSSSVYDLNEGLKNKKNCFNENNVKKNTMPDGVYGYTKRYIEKYLDKIPSYKLVSTSCRIFSIYGKNSNTIINIWKKKILKNQKINIWGNKNVVRSWLHIDDFLKAIEHILKRKTSVKIINVGSKEKTSLNDIVNIMIRKYKKKNIKIFLNENKYPGPRIRFADQRRLLKLGWKQKIFLNKGLDLIES